MKAFGLQHLNKLLIAALFVALVLVWFASRGEPFQVYRPKQEQGLNRTTTLTAIVPK